MLFFLPAATFLMCLTTFGWNKCFINSSLVISFGCFFSFHGDAMNTPNINLAQLTEQFGTDEKCRKALEQLRWKDGAKCPRCDASATPIANRFQYDCDECHYQFSVTAGTIFHDSHLSLWKWFVTTALLCESKKACRPAKFSELSE